MNTEFTLGEVYERIADQLALARAKDMMGQHEEALHLMQSATLDYKKYEAVLAGYCGINALLHAFTLTLTAINARTRTRRLATRKALSVGRHKKLKR